MCSRHIWDGLLTLVNKQFAEKRCVHRNIFTFSNAKKMLWTISLTLFFKNSFFSKCYQNCKIDFKMYHIYQIVWTMNPAFIIFNDFFSNLKLHLRYISKWVLLIYYSVCLQMCVFICCRSRLRLWFSFNARNSVL